MFNYIKQLYSPPHFIKLLFLASIYVFSHFSLALASESMMNKAVIESTNLLPWKSWRQNHTQHIEYRDIIDSNLIEIRATTTINSSLSAALLFLQDTDNIPYWLHNASQSNIVERIAVNENISITTFDAFWPVKTREMIIRSRYWQNKDLSIAVVINDESKNYQHLISKNTIQISILSAKWKISPLDNGNIYIEHSIIANPNGSIPYWLANRIALNSIWKTLINIKNLLPISPYQQDKLTSIIEVDQN